MLKIWLAVLLAMSVAGAGSGVSSQPVEDDLGDLLAPPRMVLRTSGGASQDGGEGTYCWEDEGRFVCADMFGVEIPAEPLVVGPVDVLRLDLTALGRPRRVDYVVARWEPTAGAGDSHLWSPGEDEPVREGRLAARELVWRDLDLPPGRYALVVSATFRNGDSSQGFHVLVTAAPGATPVAVGSPAASPVATPQP